jgi:hypothetical protein
MAHPPVSTPEKPPDCRAASAGCPVFWVATFSFCFRWNGMAAVGRDAAVGGQYVEVILPSQSPDLGNFCSVWAIATRHEKRVSRQARFSGLPRAF